MAAAAAQVVAARGEPERLSRLFERSPVPMVIVDDARRYIEVNPPARLAFRLTLAELRQLRIEDLTPRSLLPTMHEQWRLLLETGGITGDYEVVSTDASRLRVIYCGTSEVLPGRHLIAFVPAGWSDSDLIGDLPDVPGCRLTPRELEILELAAEGRSVREIADELVLSTGTVRTHFQNIYDEVGVRERAGAVARAIRLGLIA